jgi:hypothetical protein
MKGIRLYYTSYQVSAGVFGMPFEISRFTPDTTKCRFTIPQLDVLRRSFVCNMLIILHNFRMLLALHKLIVNLAKGILHCQGKGFERHTQQVDTPECSVLNANHGNDPRDLYYQIPCCSEYDYAFFPGHSGIPVSMFTCKKKGQKCDSLFRLGTHCLLVF